jgi:hypothetical protein
MSCTNVRFPSNVLTDGAPESNILALGRRSEKIGAPADDGGCHVRKTVQPGISLLERRGDGS